MSEYRTKEIGLSSSESVSELPAMLEDNDEAGWTVCGVLSLSGILVIVYRKDSE